MANHNLEEGFDFNENNAGDLRVDMQLVSAIGNGEEGIDLEEDDDFGGGGDLVTVMSNIVTIGNGNGADGALKIREKEAGNLDVTLTNILSVNNFGSGIFAREGQTGNSVVTITRALVSGNKISDLGDGEFGGGHGIELLESGGGELTGTVLNSNSAANEVFGVFADETGAGDWRGDIEQRDLLWRAQWSGEYGRDRDRSLKLSFAHAELIKGRR